MSSEQCISMDSLVHPLLHTCPLLSIFGEQLLDGFQVHFLLRRILKDINGLNCSLHRCNWSHVCKWYSNSSFSSIYSSISTIAIAGNGGLPGGVFQIFINHECEHKVIMAFQASCSTCPLRVTTGQATTMSHSNRSLEFQVYLLCNYVMKRQNDMTLKYEFPRSVHTQYTTGEEKRNSSRKKEAQPKQK